MKWTRRFRKTRLRDLSSRERVDWAFLIPVVLLLALMFGAVAYAYLKGPPFVERDFTGRVVDKWLTIGESQTGSRPSMRLLVEGRDGRRFAVGVTGEFYERARVGMWVSRRAGELKLSWDEPEEGAGKVGSR